MLPFCLCVVAAAAAAAKNKKKNKNVEVKNVYAALLVLDIKELNVDDCVYVHSDNKDSVHRKDRFEVIWTTRGAA